MGKRKAKVRKSSGLPSHRPGARGGLVAFRDSKKRAVLPAQRAAVLSRELCSHPWMQPPGSERALEPPRRLFPSQLRSSSPSRDNSIFLASCTAGWTASCTGRCNAGTGWSVGSTAWGATSSEIFVKTLSSSLRPRYVPLFFRNFSQSFFSSQWTSLYS